ncbi:MAG: type II toxin-antitoxin system Phd/YefM family antitoxin [Chloroflexi bacterium]|nr:type II toxin-antitoxin system Phd/YefM family antitoxin [Chloroflexota bacterium]
MEKTMGATEARVHFGEMLRRVTEEQETIVVEKDGKPQVVVISLDEYRRLQGGSQSMPDWLRLVDETRAKIALELQGKVLPETEEIIRQMRESRDSDLMDGLQFSRLYTPSLPG